ncbi:MAG: hypothetical protein KDA63_12485 [Planctomycetales bacterium]|nr:hypothetical protein [Planctomycetales bacterium]
MKRAIWPAEQQDAIDRAMSELQAKTSALDAVVHLSEAEWSVDQDEGTIVFTQSDGSQAIAPVQIIGTYDTGTNTWLWAWDNPSIDSALSADARVVQEYGQANKIEALTTRKVACDEGVCWQFTALACKLCNAQAAYRGPAGSAYVFMTFGKVRMMARKSE